MIRTRARQSAAASALAFALLAALLIAPTESDYGEVLVLAELVSVAYACWALARAKGYSGLAGLCAAALNFTGLLIILLLRDRHPELPPGTVPDALQERGLAPVAALAGTLGLLDVAMLGGGFFGILMLTWGVFVMLPRAVMARSSRPLLRLRALKTVLVVAVGALSVGFMVHDLRGTEARAALVVSQVQAFHARHQRYPETLDELRPDFLTDIPRARAFAPFSYHASPGRHTLLYVVVPPFGRRLYVFEEQRWSSID